MDKKKLIIIIVSATLALGICGFLGYNFLNEKSDEETKEVGKNNDNDVSESKEEQSNKEESEESKEKVTILKNITLDIGSKVPTIDKFTENEVEDVTIVIYDGKKKVTSKTLDKVGDYTVKITIGDEEYESTIKVVDEEKPKLTLKKVTIKAGKTYKVFSFVKFCTDNSGDDCELSFAKSAMGKYTKLGTYDIEIIAKDESGNSVSKKTKLVIEKNETSEKESTNENNNDTDSGKENENDGSSGNNSGSQEQEKEPEQSTEENPSTPPKEEESEDTIKTTEEWKSTASSNATTYNAMINEVLENVNAYRAEVGAAPLTLDTNLTLAANIRAVEMGTYNGWNISHTRPNGTQCFTVLNELGISYNTAGENIAAGYTTGDDVSEGWKNSSGHYANMIKAGFTKIGIGVAKVDGVYYWVQLFIG